MTRSQNTRSRRTARGAISGTLAVLGAVGCLAVAGPAAAEWRRAESPRFIVYSDGSERALREYVRKLETFDYFLRAQFGLPQDQATRKLPIYLVGGTQSMQRVRPGIGARVAGYYVPGGEDIHAVAIRGADDDYLLHEYFHHFSFQAQAATGYPGWLTEGLAEYYMTARVEDDGLVLGDYNAGRARVLTQGNWIPLEELLTKRWGEIRPGTRSDTYYPVAWLLTHWFLSDPARRPQLQAYIDAVRAGTPSIEAMQAATGLSLEALRSRLQAYLGAPFQLSLWDIERAAPEITVTTLPRSADDLLLLGQRMKGSVPEDRRAETAAAVRRAAARHPDDPFALLQLGHAELHFGDPVAGEAVLTRLLEIEPNNVEALQLMASRRAKQAEENPAEAELWPGRARSYLSRAYQADPDNYFTLYLLARSREGSAGYPNANDLDTWTQAFVLAPQMPGIRLGWGAALMRAERYDQAIPVLEPLANAVHGGAAIQAAQTLLERARAGQPPLAPEALDRATEADDAAPPRPTPDGEPAPPEDEPEPTPEPDTPAT